MLCHDKTHFWRQLSAYRNRFSDDRILVLFFEDFVTDPLTAIRQCYEFLNVDPTFTPRQSNTARGQTGAYHVDGAAVRLARRLKLDELTRELLPLKLRSGVRQMLSTAHRQQRPVWNGSSRAYWAELIGDDNRRFLAHYGKSPDFWEL